MADVAVHHNDADVTISLLIIIKNVIHSVINTSSLIISNIQISSISIIKSTILIINLTQTQSRHAAPDTEQHPPKEKEAPTKSGTLARNYLYLTYAGEEHDVDLAGSEKQCSEVTMTAPRAGLESSFRPRRWHLKAI